MWWNTCECSCVKPTFLSCFHPTSLLRSNPCIHCWIQFTNNFNPWSWVILRLKSSFPLLDWEVLRLSYLLKRGWEVSPFYITSKRFYRRELFIPWLVEATEGVLWTPTFCGYRTICGYLLPYLNNVSTLPADSSYIHPERHAVTSF